jgi:hypothetical protein
MGIIRADLHDLDRLDIEGQGFPLPPFPRRRILNRAEQASLLSAVELSALLLDAAPVAPIIQQVIDVAEDRPTLVVEKPSAVPVNNREFTIAVGINPEIFAIVGVTGTVGIYASTTGEVGLFSSLGGGDWVFNFGLSVGGVVTEIFGPPSDLAGVSVGMGCDVQFGLGIGGLALFSGTRPSRFLGISVSIALGPSAIPFDFTFQATDTRILPVLRLGS